MPAGGPDRIVIVPPCARTCVYVRWLLERIDSAALRAELGPEATESTSG